MTARSDEHRGWYTSRKLPHFDSPDVIQFITFRLADSLPTAVLKSLKSESKRLPDVEHSYAVRAQIELHLDRGHGCCVLTHPSMAATLRQALQFYAGKRYELIAWCIMPNHVHVLIKPTYSLPRIVQGWKAYTARWALQSATTLDLQLPERGFWMRGYWDRYVRSQAHLEASVRYIHHNPVKAKLCDYAEDWAWSSAGAARTDAATNLGCW